MNDSATYGGKGWHLREASHKQDLTAGVGWMPCGLSSETAPLTDVILHFPGDELAFPEDPDHWLMLERPDIQGIQAEAQGLADAYADAGVRVHRANPRGGPPPNFLFQRDLFFMTPEGAILSRPASPRRSAEAPLAAEVLAGLGVPILATPRGGALLEGADVLWLREDLVAVGVGHRTNKGGHDLVQSVLKEMGVETRSIPMPRQGVQHLLGLVNLATETLAVVREALAPAALTDLLRDLEREVLSLPDDEEMLEGLALNFVSLGRGRILMPDGCPQTRARYESAGLAVSEAVVTQYRKAAGGIGCATGVLARG
jgi:N-dimethylarginine dimethylaminohydrolase